MAEKKPSSILRRLKLILLTVSLIIAISFIGYGAILIGGSIVVDEDELILDATTTIETADGEVIGEMYHENRIPISIEKIPEHVQQAFIAVEDQRFYEHAGIDLKSIIRASFRNIAAMSKVEGGSTITQQLAKNLFLSNDKTWSRKAKEAMAAVYLEQKFSKEQLLELYLNEIYFGEGVYGIEAAANHFFSKSADDLTIAEGALLAGMVKGPNGYSPINHPEKALDRRNIVIDSMEDVGFISSETSLTEKGKTLGLNVNEKETNPWVDSYIDLVTKEAAEKHQLSIDELKRGGYRIVVNMNPNAQKTAYEQFQRDEYFPGNTEDAQGAFIMMEQQTGRIVSVIGGRDYQLGDLNRATVRRQPGSTMKPIAVYAPAMMQEEKYTPYTLIPDRQMDHDGYMVSNADHQYAGAVTIYNALVNSKNAPTVWLLDQIGINYAKDYLDRLGLPIEDDGLAIALGGLEKGISPLKMMESYRTFVGGGATIEAHTIDRIFDRNDDMIFEAEPGETEVFSPQVSWNMTEMLYEAVEQGTATPGEFPKSLAGKTGSTQHPFVEGETKDAWFVGYTPEYVSAMWMGYDQTDEDHYLTGGSEYPTRLTKEILTEMDKLEPLQENFAQPDNVNDLPKPIQLPEITNLQASYEFGGFSLLQGKLSWEGSGDDRVVYRIYREQDGIDERVGEVKGETEFTISDPIFQSNRYYVTAYDPLTELEGKRSETIELTW